MVTIADGELHMMAYDIEGKMYDYLVLKKWGLLGDRSGRAPINPVGGAGLVPERWETR